MDLSKADAIRFMRGIIQKTKVKVNADRGMIDEISAGFLYNCKKKESGSHSEETRFFVIMITTKEIELEPQKEESQFYDGINRR